MFLRMLLALTLSSLSSSAAIATNQQKTILPASVLKAHNVVVLVDPDACMSVTDPFTNTRAQDQVENALMKWGRFTMVPDIKSTDLLIVIRTETRKAVQPTIGGVPTNDPVIVHPTDIGPIPIGGQKGHPPGAPQRAPQDTTAHRQVEVGQSEDMFVVYEGHVERPIELPPVSRYITKKALRSPDVRAVGEFRKLIEEAEKQQKRKP